MLVALAEKKPFGAQRQCEDAQPQHGRLGPDLGVCRECLLQHANRGGHQPRVVEERAVVDQARVGDAEVGLLGLACGLCHDGYELAIED